MPFWQPDFWKLRGKYQPAVCTGQEEEEMAEEKDINPHYLIGPDDHNGICLRMGNGYGNVTLSMTPNAVIDMIHQLAAMIRKDYEVTVHRTDPDEKH